MCWAPVFAGVDPSYDLLTFAQVSRRPTVRLKTRRPGVESAVAAEIALALELHGVRRVAGGQRGLQLAPRQHLQRIRVEIGGEVARRPGSGLANSWS